MTSAQKNQTLCGIHAVSEALRSRRSVERIVVVRGTRNPRIQEIISEASREKVPVQHEFRTVLDQIAHSSKHQGIIALVKTFTHQNLGGFLSELCNPGLIVVLDGVEDPRNLGAIIRSAQAAGANGIIVAERRSAPLSETVAKSASGALEHLPVIRVKNISRSLTTLKQAGFWIFGLDENGSQDYDQVDLALPVALVMGGENKGLRQLTEKRCDILLRIPMHGPITSLNVSVAAGIALFEAAKQRRAHSLHARV